MSLLNLVQSLSLVILWVYLFSLSKEVVGSAGTQILGNVEVPLDKSKKSRKIIRYATALNPKAGLGPQR